MHKKNDNTESIPLNNNFIDKMLDEEAISFLLEGHVEAAKVVQKELFNLKNISLEIYNHLKKNDKSRLIYAGAGTSGRIAIQDGIELIPTFGWDAKRIDFILAGGEKALLQSIENAEDNEQVALENVEDKQVTSKDVVIAVSASGTTPFTVAVAKESKKRGALTIGVSNNKDTLLNKNVDFSLSLISGAEALAGSTRLKAGTAQKICLNTISTFVMSKLGRIKNGRMSYLIPMNKKLRDRLDEINRDIVN